MENKKQTEIMNNVIVDLKLKIDRLNYTLTALLDVNNITETSKKLIDNKITLINPDEHKNIISGIMSAIDTANKAMLRVQKDLNPEAFKKGDKKDE